MLGKYLALKARTAQDRFVLTYIYIIDAEFAISKRQFSAALSNSV